MIKPVVLLPYDLVILESSTGYFRNRAYSGARDASLSQNLMDSDAGRPLSPVDDLRGHIRHRSPHRPMSPSRRISPYRSPVRGISFGRRISPARSPSRRLSPHQFSPRPLSPDYRAAMPSRYRPMSPGDYRRAEPMPMHPRDLVHDPIFREKLRREYR